MPQMLINDIKPQSRKILASQVYTATTGALLKDFAGEDITGGGWIVGVDVVIGSGGTSFVTLHDGVNAQAMPLVDVQPRTVLNVNVELTTWRKFDSTVFLATTLSASSRVIVYYYQDA